MADWLCPKTNLKTDFSNLRAFGSGYRRDILLGRGAQGSVQLGISILMASARALRAPAVVNIHGISLFPCCARCSHYGASSGPEHMGLRIQHVFFSDWRSSSTWVPIGLTWFNWLKPNSAEYSNTAKTFPNNAEPSFRWRFRRGLDQPLLKFSVLRSLRTQQVTG